MKRHSTSLLERLNKEVKRRVNGVGIFPNEDSITRLIGAALLEQDDEYPVPEPPNADRGHDRSRQTTD